MDCGYCGSPNADEESRCIRCGVPLGSAGAHRARGAALPAPVPPPSVVPIQRKDRSAPRAPQQQSLFRVIPFEAIEAQRKPASQASAGVSSSAAAPRSGRSRSRNQAGLFPHVEEKQKAPPPPVVSVKCQDAPVAGLGPRLQAAIVDHLIVAATFLALLVGFHLLLGGLPLNLTAGAIYASIYALLFTWYKILAAACGRCSVGPRMAGLKVLHFSGRPPSRGHRLLRVFGGYVSLLPGGLGFLWPLVDAEGLAIHDHVSDTYLTQVETHR